jgi:hypothetical protein
MTAAVKATPPTVMPNRGKPKYKPAVVATPIAKDLNALGVLA